MIVRFHTIDQFLNELRRDARLIERRILRVTLRRKYVPPMTTVTLVATAAVGTTAVTYECFLGEVMFRDPTLPPAIHEAGNPILDRFGAFAEEVGLEVRPGVYEPAGG